MTELPVLDELMANAWPSAVVERRDGWRFRWASGVTRRANSALAIGGAGGVASLVSDAEEFYRSHGAPPLIQVSSAAASPALVPYLEAQGYRPTARTLVVRARTSDVVARTELGTYEAEVADHATDDWFETYWSVESTRGRSADDAVVCRDVLLAPLLPAAFVAIRRGSAVASVGQIVVDGGWAGVQCMATPPPCRRQGAATAVLHVLAKEAAQRDAEHMYLAVMANNPPARQLYASAGFHRVHEYSYFAKWAPDSNVTEIY